MEMLTVKDVKKSFDGVEILKGISLTVEKGGVLAIIGPSGSGKSTLLRCITQLETVDAGEISICGESLVKNSPTGTAVYSDKAACAKIGLHIGLVFQNFNLFPHFSVLQNITEAPVRVLGKTKEEANKLAHELLEKMGLQDKADAYPYQLSGGQQQRVSIARALAMNPDILFFDEPTSALYFVYCFCSSWSCFFAKVQKFLTENCLTNSLFQLAISGNRNFASFFTYNNNKSIRNFTCTNGSSMSCT